ncbi:hypothetical protein N9174_01700 [bacterium]|nr:hypothetical protein [bacterium]
MVRIIGGKSVYAKKAPLNLNILAENQITERKNLRTKIAYNL